MYLPLAVLASFAFVYSVTSGRIDKTPFTGPIVFISFGLFVGPFGLGWLDYEATATEIRILADLTLAMVLFSDAAHVDRSALVKGIAVPARMLIIGLPGVVALGWLCGWLIFDDLSVWEIAILAVALAATDAALGKAVFTNRAVPVHVRESLNLESGLNDGLCVPVLLLLIAVAGTGVSETEAVGLVARYFAQELGIGIAVGSITSLTGFWLYRRARARKWIQRDWQQQPIVMLALACFAIAQTLHGSGFISAFVGGLLFGYAARRRAAELVLSTEEVGETLGMLTWALFGSVVIPAVIDALDLRSIAYAVLSLTVIRMLPIMLSLTGCGERIESKLFLAWFGPRGLASIVFAVIVLNNDIPGAERISVVVASTIVLSVFVHGLSAHRFASLLGKRLERRV